MASEKFDLTIGDKTQKLYNVEATERMIAFPVKGKIGINANGALYIEEVNNLLNGGLKFATTYNFRYYIKARFPTALIADPDAIRQGYARIGPHIDNGDNNTRSIALWTYDNRTRTFTTLTPSFNSELTDFTISDPLVDISALLGGIYEAIIEFVPIYNPPVTEEGIDINAIGLFSDTHNDNAAWQRVVRLLDISVPYFPYGEIIFVSNLWGYYRGLATPGGDLIDRRYSSRVVFRIFGGDNDIPNIDIMDVTPITDNDNSRPLPVIISVEKTVQPDNYLCKITVWGVSFSGNYDSPFRSMYAQLQSYLGNTGNAAPVGSVTPIVTPTAAMSQLNDNIHVYDDFENDIANNFPDVQGNFMRIKYVFDSSRPDFERG